MNKDYLILIHGLKRSSLSMKKLEKHFSKLEYIVLNFNYPSSKFKIGKLSKNYLKPFIEKNCNDKKKKINFITHSLGGILLRYFLANNKLKQLNKIVMLAPPNKGSKYADFFSKIKLANMIMGPALKQLKTDKNSIPNKIITKQTNKIGIIAGKFDDKVPADFAKLKGMADFLIVPHVHSFIMYGDKVIEASENFLKNGEFKD